MRSIAAIAIAIVMTAQSDAVAQSQLGIAGYLTRLVPGNGRVDVIRTGRPIPTDRGMKLYDGDTIIITGNAKIYIMSYLPNLNGDRDSSSSPIRFPIRKPPSSSFLSAFFRLSQALKIPGSIVERPPTGSAQVPTKGVADCPSSPRFRGELKPARFLEARVQHRENGKYLTLAWMGGTPPYVIEYGGGAGWTKLSLSPVCLSHATVEVPTDMGASTQLRIRDAVDKEIMWDLKTDRSTVSGGASDDDQMVDAMTDLSDPAGRFGMAALTKLNGISDRNFFAWRIMAAVYDNNLDP